MHVSPSRAQARERGLTPCYGRLEEKTPGRIESFTELAKYLDQVFVGQGLAKHARYVSEWYGRAHTGRHDDDGYGSERGILLPPSRSCQH